MSTARNPSTKASSKVAIHAAGGATDSSNTTKRKKIGPTQTASPTLLSEVAPKVAPKAVRKSPQKTDTVDTTKTVNVPPILIACADYWDEACLGLMKSDRILRKLIPQHGPARLESRGDPFTTLARSIVGQQISVKAAQSVWNRLLDACPKPTPKRLLKLTPEKLATCGLSRRKAEYILDLATHFESGAVQVKHWASMNDEAVIAELVQIRGIGRWTAEMFLMFHLLRPNVLPLDDLGLIRAISVNYFSGEPVTRSEAREVAANWEPWRTVATWYMWRSLDPIAVEY